MTTFPGMATERERGAEAEGALGRVLDRNIAALVARRREEERRQPRTDKIAERVGRFAGSMTFVWIHVAIVAWWVATNTGLLPGPRFDESFVKLATAASVEAIFISTFVLVTQNRMATLADKRADLDLQISLLAEHELTRLIRLSGLVARRLGVDDPGREELEELERDVSAEKVLDRIEQAEERDRGAPPL